MGFCCCQPIHFRLFQFKCGISLFFFFFFLSFLFFLIVVMRLSTSSQCREFYNNKDPVYMYTYTDAWCFRRWQFWGLVDFFFLFQFLVLLMLVFLFSYFSSHTPKEIKRESDFCSHISFRLPNAHFPLTIIQTNTEKTDVIELKSGGGRGRKETVGRWKGMNRPLTRIINLNTPRTRHVFPKRLFRQCPVVCSFLMFSCSAYCDVYTS